MTEPKQCSTCHWWFRFDNDKPGWGKCVWHNGVQSTMHQQITFDGILATRREFGCIKHEEDKRQ